MVVEEAFDPVTHVACCLKNTIASHADEGGILLCNLCDVTLARCLVPRMTKQPVIKIADKP